MIIKNKEGFIKEAERWWILVWGTPQWRWCNLLSHIWQTPYLPPSTVHLQVSGPHIPQLPPQHTDKTRGGFLLVIRGRPKSEMPLGFVYQSHLPHKAHTTKPSSLTPCLKESKRQHHVSARERHDDDESVIQIRWLCHCMVGPSSTKQAHKSTSADPPLLLFFFLLPPLRLLLFVTSRFNLTVPRRSQCDVTAFTATSPPMWSIYSSSPATVQYFRTTWSYDHRHHTHAPPKLVLSPSNNSFLSLFFFLVSLMVLTNYFHLKLFRIVVVFKTKILLVNFF